MYLLLCHTTACEKASQAMQDDPPSTFAHWTNTGVYREEQVRVREELALTVQELQKALKLR